MDEVSFTSFFFFFSMLLFVAGLFPLPSLGPGWFKALRRTRHCPFYAFHQASNAAPLEQFFSIRNCCPTSESRSTRWAVSSPGGRDLPVVSPLQHHIGGRGKLGVRSSRLSPRGRAAPISVSPSDAIGLVIFPRSLPWDTRCTVSGR